eukprot:s1060_g13.t2
MEILVDHSLGIPTDAILSVRCGGTRRQAPMETICNHPLKFPLGLGEVGEPLKIDLLQPLASARLVLHPYEDLYSISFQEKGGGRESRQRCSQLRQGLLGAARKYVQSLLHAVIQAKPPDPYAYMIEQLSAAQSKRPTVADIVSRPGSALGARRHPQDGMAVVAPPLPPPPPKTLPPAEQVRPVPPAEPPPSSSPPGRPRPPERELVHVDPAPRIPPPEPPAAAFAKHVPVPLPPPMEIVTKPVVGINGPVDVEAAPSVDLMDKEVPDDSLEQVRLQLKGRLEEAFRSGNLEEAVRKAIDPEADQPAEKPEMPEESPDLPGVEGPDEEIFGLKMQLRVLLADAVESKGLQKTLATEPLNFAEPDPKLRGELEVQESLYYIKQDLRTSLEGACETGELQKLLPPGTVANAPMELEDIKDKMRQLLQNSVSTGSLEQSLEKIKANPPEKVRACSADTSADAPPPPPATASSEKVEETETKAAVAKPARVRDESYAGMILQLSGQWFLNGQVGRYDFDDSTGWLSLGDVSVGRFLCKRMQETPLQNRGALFVIPSQFNAAEYPYHTDVVFHAEDYKHENGSGPRGQLAVHPAVAQFILDNAANVKREGGINALDEVLRKVPGLDMVNGYLRVEDLKSSKAQEETLRSVHWSWMRSPSGVVSPQTSGTSADANTKWASNRDGDSEYQMKVAELLLVAQYYGALKYAAESMRDSGRPASPSGRRTRKVYLMPLGTGVFHNSWEMIAKSMAKAVQMLDSEMISQLDISALARQGNPSEELNLQETFYRLNKNSADDSVESTKVMLREMLESAAETWPRMGSCKPPCDSLKGNIDHDPSDPGAEGPRISGRKLAPARKMPMMMPPWERPPGPWSERGGPPGHPGHPGHPWENFGPWGAPPFPDQPAAQHLGQQGPPGGGCRPPWGPFDGPPPRGPMGPDPGFGLGPPGPDWRPPFHVAHRPHGPPHGPTYGPAGAGWVPEALAQGPGRAQPGPGPGPMPSMPMPSVGPGPPWEGMRPRWPGPRFGPDGQELQDLEPPGPVGSPWLTPGGPPQGMPPGGPAMFLPGPHMAPALPPPGGPPSIISSGPLPAPGYMPPRPAAPMQLVRHIQAVQDVEVMSEASPEWAGLDRSPMRPGFSDVASDKGSVALGSMGSLSALSHVEDAASEAARALRAIAEEAEARMHSEQLHTEEVLAHQARHEQVLLRMAQELVDLRQAHQALAQAQVLWPSAQVTMALPWGCRDPCASEHHSLLRRIRSGAERSSRDPGRQVDWEAFQELVTEKDFLVYDPPQMLGALILL